MVRPEGFEPPAYRFEACRSIQLSYGRALEVGTFYRALVHSWGVCQAATIGATKPIPMLESRFASARFPRAGHRTPLSGR